jgi:hypothetical protein
VRNLIVQAAKCPNPKISRIVEIPSLVATAVKILKLKHLKH